jgi:CheY-like chemotaxis protein
MSYLEKSVTKETLVQAFSSIEHSVQTRVKKLLLVSGDVDRRRQVHSILDGEGLEIIEATSGGHALAVAGQNYMDGMVLDIRLSDIPAIDFVKELQQQFGSQVSPIVLYSKRALTAGEAAALSQLSRVSLVKHAQSPERLLDEATLLLHLPESSLSEPQREILAEVRRNDETLAGKKVLVVDDDLRNIFALTSVLEQHKLKVVHAENGRTGIGVLQETPDVDAVLMDIMMPEMDGYETTRAIRQLPEFQSLPIIALTAKAMKGDRDKCLEAGASDYVTKPVDLDQLFSVLRVWIARGREAEHTLVAGLER